MRLGMFMMPVHPPDRTFWSTLEEDTEKSLLADALGFAEADRRHGGAGALYVRLRRVRTGPVTRAGLGPCSNTTE